MHRRKYIPEYTGKTCPKCKVKKLVKQNEACDCCGKIICFNCNAGFIQKDVNIVVSLCRDCLFDYFQTPGAKNVSCSICFKNAAPEFYRQ